MVPGLNLRLIALLVGAAALFSAGWAVNGWRVGKQFEELKASHQQRISEAHERRLQAERAARDLEQERQEKTNAIAAAAEAKREARAARSERTTERIIEYVQTPAATRHRLDAEWVHIHDIAAVADGSGGVSSGAATAREFDAGAGTVTAADALLVITDNYDRCHAARDRLIDLQRWIRTALVE